MQSKTLSVEIGTVVQNAIDEGRSHLNDEEANYLLRISQKLVEDFVNRLENMPEN